MNTRPTNTAIGTILALLGLGGIALAQETPREAGEKSAEMIAVLVPTEGNETTATVTFTPVGEGKVLVRVKAKGLKPNSKHGIHIHQFGDASAPDGSSAGGHFNPEDVPHGLPKEDEERHAGDLGNLQADENGEASLELTVNNLELKGDESILGRSVIIHEQPDTGEQPTGGAGDRIAQGVIGIRQSQEKVAAAETSPNN